MVQFPAVRREEANMNVKLVNSISLNMFPGRKNIRMRIEEISRERFVELLLPRFESYIGHRDLADLLTSMLGVTIGTNRSNYTYEDGDVIAVAQYVGPRLPEGTNRLPDGAEIRFFVVVID